MTRRNVYLALCLVSAITTAAAAQERIPDAAQRDDAAAVRRLLGANADVNVAQGDGMTALHWAAFHDDREMAEVLLARGANIHSRTRNGGLTPLLVAAGNGNATVLEAIVKAGADVQSRSSDGATALMMAAGSGNAGAVSILLDHGAEIEATDTARGQTPLMFAAAANRVEVVRLLLARGAQSRHTSSVFSPPRLARVSANPNAPVPAPPKPTDMISEAKATRRASPSALGGWAALHFAAREGHVGAARALLESGADVNQRNAGDKSTPLITAIVNGHYDLAKLLIEKGADPNLANDDGLAPLYATVDMQFAPVIWQPNPPTEQEHVSHVELMKLLLDRGADPNARLGKKLWFRPSDHDDMWTGTAGTTAFWRASFATDVEAMKLLVTRGADPNIPSLEGVTPLMASAGLGWTGNQHRTVPDSWLPAVKLCLELGAELNARDVFNYTALHAAAYRGDNALVTFLVEKGARLDVVTIFGTNITDMANGFVAFGSLPQEHPDTVQLLVGLGAPKPTPGDRAYCTAADLNCPVVTAAR
jgi:ankyrin repeat protein